tara:strand:- start:2709 stop:3245 length:537 start_codon:yes stop_codon:yes gene_type:complete
MVSNEMTVSQLVEMGIKLESLQSFVAKEMQRSKRQILKEEREQQKAETTLKVLEVINADPSVGWKTGLLVQKIFGLTRTGDSKLEDERHRVHGLISASLKDLTESGAILKKQIGGNACHTWYQSTHAIPEATFEVVSQVEESTQDIDSELLSQVINDLEDAIQDEEDFQEAINDALNS